MTRPTPRAIVSSTGLSRRDLLAASAAAAAISIVPASVFGQAPPNSKPNLAGIGVGGVGFSQLQGCEKAGFNIACLCDVDDVHAKKAYDKWPQARRYRDYREMFQAEGDKIDAVYVGTPDHVHALPVMAALRRKKHVCCVKPLTRTVSEGRTLLKAAKEAGVATQMTASPNTSEVACRTCEYIQGGLLGEVREVHIWSNRPVWPQGMTRPAGEDPVPSTLDWKLWLGPAAQRPFKANWPAGHTALTELKAAVNWVAGNRGVYLPFNFRGWWDFGCGALGDMGCHHFNTVFRALKLTAPTTVSASSTKVFPETAPLASIVTYDFPAREGLPPVRLVWYDGGLQPPPPIEMGNQPMPEDGTLYVGEQGKLLAGWGDVKVLPASRLASANAIPRTLTRRGGTWQEWFEAATTGKPAGCAFDWAVPLTEIVLLGNIAIRSGKPLNWDPAGMKFSNQPAANPLLRAEYQNGWSLENI